MKIGILAAMGKEMELLKPIVENIRECELDGRKAWLGSVGSHEVCLMQCGIGKVNSALNAERMLRAFEPELVINSGVAGGADLSMAIGDLLVATEAAYHDVWCGPGTEYGAADGFEPRMACSQVVVEKARGALSGTQVKYGLICSGDKFVSSAGEVREIKGHFPDALACDMESASIMQTCRARGVECAVVRVVSDTPGSGRNVEQYTDFWSEAPRKTFEAVKRLLLAL